MRILLNSLLCVFTLSLTAQEACFNPFANNGEIVNSPTFSLLGSFDSKQYYISDNPINISDNFYGEFNALANSYGGNLLSINSFEENQFIYDSFVNQSLNYPSYYIGLFNTAPSNLCCGQGNPPGVWEWISGEDVVYTNWDINNNQPSGNELHASGSVGLGGLWIDVSGGHLGHIILEIDLCIAFEYGCTDATAFNYNAEANTDDGSCIQGITQENIYQAVDAWLEDSVSTEAIYGHISDWDVSNVTDMSFMNADGTGLFEGATSFNGDLSSWDVSSATHMGGMFYGANSFNGDISSWDVSNVTNMYAMFQGANSFNEDISSWDVSNVTSMHVMFEGASSLSEENQYAIQTSFSTNPNWPYQWQGTLGCTNSLALNYDELANTDDGLCIAAENECSDSTTFNFNPEIQVGDFAEGGIVFYIDETGQYGLVAATQNLEGTYEWGCSNTSISGADSTSIGAGYQNTIDIVNQDYLLNKFFSY